jgi:hypothetical protein
MVEESLPLVPGSDAHEPSHVALGLEALEGIGLVRYRARRILRPGADPRVGVGVRAAPGA